MTKKDCDQYFENKDRIYRWIPRPGLRYEIYGSLFCYVVLIVLLLFIVNNGNILTDGTDKRKYLRRKYNDL